MQSSRKIPQGQIQDFISPSTQTALNLKAPLNNPSFSGTVKLLSNTAGSMLGINSLNNIVTYSGITNFNTKWNSLGGLSSGIIFDNGTNVLINSITDNGIDRLQVSGSVFSTVGFKLSGGTNNQYLLADGSLKNVTTDINNVIGVTYTFSGSDSTKRVIFSNTNPISATIPLNASVPIPIGTKIEFTQTGTGVVTLIGSVNIITNIALYSSQGETRRLMKVDTDTWTLEGTPINSKFKTIGVTFDGGAGIVDVGQQAELNIPYNMTIQSWNLIGTNSGSCVVDIWKQTFANYPPTNANTITGSALPNISGTTKGSSSNLSGWTTSLNTDDVLIFNINSNTTINRITLQLRCALI